MMKKIKEPSFVVYGGPDISNVNSGTVKSSNDGWKIELLHYNEKTKKWKKVRNTKKYGVVINN